jgi:hypothetical protein
MATETEQSSEQSSGRTSSAVVRGMVAAAATGAAAYGVQRFRSSRSAGGSEEPERNVDDDAEAGEGEGSGRREELTQALTEKIGDAKRVASRLKPGGGRSTVETAWDAASDYLVPFANEAAASLGETVATKAPEIVRDDLLPRFIDGFQKAHR